ncbi:hypothetical protein [Neptuniibacter sp. QD37_11]|uniref:hypothetical protein n=1 Tax=Neptuniibacter sp. QD37_11 TaxID=3398209 RepID=UPI0039F526E0
MNHIAVNKGALQVALSALRRSGKGEIADALSESCAETVAPDEFEDALSLGWSKCTAPDGTAMVIQTQTNLDKLLKEQSSATPDASYYVGEFSIAKGCYLQNSDRMSFENAKQLIGKVRKDNPQGDYMVLAVVDC